MPSRLSRKYNIQEHAALIADDESFSLSIVGRQLKEIGIETIHAAQNGKEALGILTADFEHKIKLVVLDINMPKQNGLQVLKKIRTGWEDIERSIPAIMLTGNTDSDLVGAALALDVDSFIAKPVSKAALEKRIRNLSVEDRPIKSAEEYAAVDIEVAKKLRQRETEDKKVKGPVIRKSEEEEKKGRKVALNEVEPGSVVSETVHTSTGQVLLTAGNRLSERLLRKLKELKSVGEPLHYIWIEKE